MNSMNLFIYGKCTCDGCFGETQDKFAKLGNSQGKYVIKATDVEDAVDKIQDIVEPNDVVLLSPACKLGSVSYI